METLVGFAFGFMLGTREGRQGLTKIRESLAAIRGSADIQHLVGEAAGALGPVVRELVRVTGGAS